MDLVVVAVLVVLVVMDHLVLVAMVVLVLDYHQLSVTQDKQVHHLHGLAVAIK
jgi:hypothetical protein